MTDLRKTNRAAEGLLRSTGDSYKSVVDHVVALQERNARFFWGVFEDFAEEARRQAEINREFGRELVERAEAQRETVRALAGETVDTYMELLYAPLAYYRQGLRLVEGSIEGEELPIKNYDELSVAEISKRLDGLSAEEIRYIRDYEKLHKNRESLLEQLDRKLKPAAS